MEFYSAEEVALIEGVSLIEEGGSLQAIHIKFSSVSRLWICILPMMFRGYSYNIVWAGFSHNLVYKAGLLIIKLSFPLFRVVQFIIIKLSFPLPAERWKVEPRGESKCQGMDLSERPGHCVKMHILRESDYFESR